MKFVSDSGHRKRESDVVIVLLCLRRRKNGKNIRDILESGTAFRKRHKDCVNIDGIRTDRKEFTVNVID